MSTPASCSGARGSGALARHTEATRALAVENRLKYTLLIRPEHAKTNTSEASASISDNFANPSQGADESIITPAPGCDIHRRAHYMLTVRLWYLRSPSMGGLVGHPKVIHIIHYADKSRDWASSSFKRPAGGKSPVVSGPPPTSDSARRGSPAAGPPTRPSR